MAFVTWLIVRFVHYTGSDLQAKQRMIEQADTAQLEERRREVEAQLVSQKDWQRVIGQAAADALGQSVEVAPQIPPRVGGRPAPYLTVMGMEGTRYVFTTDVAALEEVGLVRKRAKRVALSSPVEPGAVWLHLAERHLRKAQEVVPAIPRDAEWFLVVVEEKK